MQANELGLGYVILMVFLWVSVAAEYHGRIYNTIINLDDHKQLNLKTTALRAIFFVLMFMAAFRGMDITNDTIAYYRTYQKIAFSGFAGETRMEIGYVALNVLLSHIFSNNLVGYQVLLIVTSLFSYLALEQWLERHANTYGICVIAFYFLSNQGFMSAIRQSVAVGLVLWALMTWEDLKGWKQSIVYILLITIAACFHKTALIALAFPILARQKYTRNTTWLLIAVTLLITLTNFVGRIISFLGIGEGYITSEVGNAANVAVMSLLYFALLLLRTFTSSKNYTVSNRTDDSGTILGDDFYTYCIALSLSITVMSLRAPAMSRLNMYLQLAGLPYISNVMSRIRDRKLAFLIKIIFSVAIWSYSVIVLIYRPEWQHLWPYHFCWQ